LANNIYRKNRMPQYRVDGADSVTGFDRTLMVEAMNESEARASATAQGLFVSGVFQQYNNKPQYSSTTPTVKVPDYVGLSISAFVLRILAILIALGGLLGGALMAITMIHQMGAESTPLALLLAGLYFIAPVAIAAIFYGASAACIALQDIARNSFKL
jgi:type II secretory pathway component PulF